MNHGISLDVDAFLVPAPATEAEAVRLVRNDKEMAPLGTKEEVAARLEAELAARGVASARDPRTAMPVPDHVDSVSAVTYDDGLVHGVIVMRCTEELIDALSSMGCAVVTMADEVLALPAQP